MTLNAMQKRPGITKLHSFRSNVVAMLSFRDRLYVMLESGKAYRSNLKATRWYRIKPWSP